MRKVIHNDPEMQAWQEEVRDYVPLKAISARVGVSISTIRYHYCKLRHRVESNKGPGGGYRLIR